MPGFHCDDLYIQIQYANIIVDPFLVSN